MLDHSITESQIEDRQDETDREPDEPEFDGGNVQLNVDQQSYGEQSTTDDCDNVTKNCDQEITKAREILEQTKSMREESSKEYEQQNKTSRNDTT